MTQTAERATVLITEEAERQAQRLAHAMSSTSVLAALDEATTVRLPDEIEQVLREVITLLSQGKHVVISSMPEELTTSMAAEQLGISRPTLMKHIRSGELRSFKVGSHHRVRRGDLEAFRRTRLERQAAAFDALHALEDQLDAQ